jgi:transmembrane sensor
MTVPPLANEPPDWDAIARHRAGETVGDEARRIAAWLDANPVDARMLAALDDAVGGALRPDIDGAAPDVEAALRSVHARMHDATASTRVLAFPVASRSGRTSKRWLAGGLAAAAAIGALAVGLARTRGASDTSASVARGTAGSVIATAVGVRDSVRLPDGTQVILAPASRLAVSPSFGAASREVTIQGMAWLAVHHDPAAPFTVRAGNAMVRDVGTAFTVRTGDGAVDAVSVTVSEGTVELRGTSATAAPAITLAAGDRGELVAGQVTAQRGVATEADVAWTRGRLVFRDTPLEVVRADLRRWYGIDLQIADPSLAGRRLTATFDDEPIDRVLQVIALALGASVERHDSVAVLRAGPMR